MGPEPDNLLESDRIEDVLEDGGPPQPVVVVQNRIKVLPWLLILGSIVVLALASAYAYHRREVARLRRQAEMAQRDLMRAIAQARAEENELRLASLPRPPVTEPPAAAATSPAPSTSPGLSVAQVSAGAGVSNMAQASAAPPSQEKPPAPAAPPSQEKPPAPAAEAGPPGSRPAGPPRPKVLAHLRDKGDPAPTPGSGPASPPGPTAQPGTVAVAGGPAGPSPFDEMNGGSDPGRAPARVDLAAEPASASGVADRKPAGPAQPGVAPAEAPLPSKEETERQIRAEAAEIQRETDQRLDQQRDELAALRNDERRQFLDELKMILKTHGRLAGPEIERLSNGAGRTEDPKLLMRARLVIAEPRVSQPAKVRKLRQLGVPETVILDYLANRLNKNLGARNGPRSKNEVWIQAAELLVKYHDLDALAARGRPAAPNAAPGGQPAAGDIPRPR